MADDLPSKMDKVKKTKAATEKKGVPAGAQGGAAATAPASESISAVKAIYDKNQPLPPEGSQGTVRG